jgi:hypothetical protein
LENCFEDDPAEVGKTILLGARAGLSGGSIEDYSGEPSKRIYDFGLAVWWSRASTPPQRRRARSTSLSR